MVLKKPKEDADFTIPKNWRPIALLSTIGKALEAVIRSTHQLGHGGVVQARDQVQAEDRGSGAQGLIPLPTMEEGTGYLHLGKKKYCHGST